MKRAVAALLIILCIQGCNLDSETGMSSLKPRAKGSIGEIVLVMDTALWKRPIGLKMKELLTAPVPGLPRGEPLYKVHFIDPDRLNNVLRGASNMIFVTTLDGTARMKNYFTPESLQKIRDNPDLFMNKAQNEFAKDQEILQLFSKNEESLLEKINANESIIRNYFNEVEKKRLLRKYETDRSEKGIEKILNSKYGFEMHVPKGFQTAISEEDFIWIRDIQYDIDQSIFITWKTYTSEEQFEKDRIIQWRNQITKNYIFADPEDTSSYVKTEVEHALVNSKTISFNEQYGVEVRALWKNSSFMGGPFISYTFLDQTTNRLYYIEALLYSPNVDQRNLMKQLEAVLWTFKPVSEQS